MDENIPLVRIIFATMLEQLNALEQTAISELNAVTNGEQLQVWQGALFGTKRSKGKLDEAMSALGKLTAEQRPAFGKRANEVKQALLAALETRQAEIKSKELADSLMAGAIDVTLPGTPVKRGTLHPTTQIIRRMTDIFKHMGFEPYTSREVETDAFNFQLLNIPEDHPARDMQDTFHTTQPGVILRTHTSPGQIRSMRELGANGTQPVRVVLPGMCYRYEPVNATHEMQFTQMEGICVGKNITLADLKGTFTEFARQMFGGDRKMRFRASYFPFTEPSVEIDVFWGLDTERDKAITKGTGWLEISGAGMMHPTVLRNGGYDPDEWSGFAFGMGPERVAMLTYGINDIRWFWQNDLRFLEQF